MKLGPIGTYLDGHSWDEKGRTIISHIFLSCDEWGIKSIQFGFVENGVLVLSKVYGKPFDQHLRIVSIDHESELLIGLSGECNENGDIVSLTFHTNQKTHGPFNALVEKPTGHVKRCFDFRISDGGEFGGFFGTSSDDHLDSIGFYFTPKLPVNPLNRPFFDAKA